MVKIDLRRKFALAAVLCLSVLMIIIAIVRVAASSLPGGVTDTAWLFFWQTMEAAVAVITVSLTAIKSLFGQNAAGSSKGTPLREREGQGMHNSTSTKDKYSRIHAGPYGVVSNIRSTAQPSNQGRESDAQELSPFDQDIHVTHESIVSHV